MTVREFLTHGALPGRPSVGDWVTSLVVSAIVAAGTAFNSAGFGPLGYLTIAAMGAVLLFRRRWPIPILLVLLLGGIGTSAADLLPVPANFLFTLMALYTVAVRTDRATVLAIGGFTTVTLYCTVVATSQLEGPSPRWDPDGAIGAVAWSLLFAAAGDATRSRRRYIETIIERARRAEAERDQEATRRVADERLRIARELHDVLAHHIAVISVQAGLAQVSLPKSPEVAVEALGHIRGATRDVMGELKALVRVLRPDGDTGSSDPAEPAPGLAMLEDLIEQHRRSGHHVDVTVAGSPYPLPAATDLTAFRIVQEALTNAGKHGTPGTTHLSVRYLPDSFHATVRNQAGTNPAPGSGLGLVGMRERAASVAADLQINHRGETFEVTVVIPMSGSEGTS